MNHQIDTKISTLLNWDEVRNSVYPVLASPVMEKSGQLQELVNTDFLDMKVIYTIWLRKDGLEAGYIRISQALFEHYKISIEELHRQALKNLNKDGYCLRDMKAILGELKGMKEGEAQPSAEESEIEAGKMFVLTNKDRMYGAAGILNRTILREQCHGKSFYILPSSVHETIFIPFVEEIDQTELDHMVSEINREQVIPEERLTSHSYFYDGQADEIRISA